MNKVIIAIMVFLTVSSVSFAQTKQSTPSATGAAKESSASAETDDIRNLKEKLENKVEQLQQTNKQAVSGVIIDVSKTALSIEGSDGKQYQIKSDDVLTSVYSISGTTMKDIEFGDLAEGDYIIAAGPQSDSTVTANTIYVDQQYIVGSGNITEVNSADFYIKVATTDRETLTIDIQKKTTQLLLDSKTLETEKIGFTKIKEGDTIHFVLIKTGDEKEKNRYDAIRTLIIPQEFFIK